MYDLNDGTDRCPECGSKEIQVIDQYRDLYEDGSPMCYRFACWNCKHDWTVEEYDGEYDEDYED